MSHGLPGPAPEERPTPEGRRNTQGIRVDPAVEAESPPRRAVISVLVDHEPGVLSEVAGLFSRRQFNIESLTVGPTADPERARITVVCEEPDTGIVQLERQLEKLLSVISVRELPDDAIRRELALVKVDCERPAAVSAVAEMYDAETVDASPETATVEVTGSRQKVEAAIESLDRFGVREIVRTGTTALARGTTRTAGAEPTAGAGSTATAELSAGAEPTAVTSPTTDGERTTDGQTTTDGERTTDGQSTTDGERRTDGGSPGSGSPGDTHGDTQ